MAYYLKAMGIENIKIRFQETIYSHDGLYFDLTNESVCFFDAFVLKKKKISYSGFYINFKFNH